MSTNARSDPGDVEEPRSGLTMELPNETTAIIEGNSRGPIHFTRHADGSCTLRFPPPEFGEGVILCLDRQTYTIERRRTRRFRFELPRHQALYRRRARTGA